MSDTPTDLAALLDRLEGDLARAPHLEHVVLASRDDVQEAVRLLRETVHGGTNPATVEAAAREILGLSRGKWFRTLDQRGWRKVTRVELDYNSGRGWSGEVFADDGENVILGFARPSLADLREGALAKARTLLVTPPGGEGL